ncbi:hypothetical protein BC628DRAFT_344030 [Trametes gibbosa]|nr:hypothetical protein BC628DRAFT_344030 [Trametes gibbosa]
METDRTPKPAKITNKSARASHSCRRLMQGLSIRVAEVIGRLRDLLQKQRSLCDCPVCRRWPLDLSSRFPRPPLSFVRSHHDRGVILKLAQVVPGPGPPQPYPGCFVAHPRTPATAHRSSPETQHVAITALPTELSSLCYLPLLHSASPFRRQGLMSRCL